MKPIKKRIANHLQMADALLGHSLTEAEWDELGTTMLSLHFMDSIKKMFPQPFNKKDLAEVIGKSESYVDHLCYGDKLLTMKNLQDIRKKMKVYFDLTIRNYE